MTSGYRITQNETVESVAVLYTGYKQSCFWYVYVCVCSSAVSIAIATTATVAVTAAAHERQDFPPRRRDVGYAPLNRINN